MQRINLALPGEKSAQHLWGRAGARGRAGQGRAGAAARGAPSPAGSGQPGSLAANTSLPLPSSSSSSSPRARAMIPLPPLPPGRRRRCRRRESPHGARQPVAAPAAGPGPSAGLRGRDVSPAGRAMVSAPQARVTTAGLAAPRPPRTHSPPLKTFNRGPPPEKVPDPPRVGSEPRGPPAGLAASGGDPGTVLPRPGGEGGGGGGRQAGRQGGGGQPPAGASRPAALHVASAALASLPSTFLIQRRQRLPPIFLTQTCCRAAPGINAAASFSPAANPSLPRPPPPPPPRQPAPDRLSSQPCKFHTLQINPRGGRAKRLAGSGGEEEEEGCFL